jgi:hypothetical protein
VSRSCLDFLGNYCDFQTRPRLSCAIAHLRVSFGKNGVRAMRKFFTINNCKFSYQCPRAWERLDVTASDGERYCDTCQRIVHLCEDDATLTHHVEAGHCVAVADTARGEMLVGQVSPNGPPQRLEEPPPSQERQWLKIAPSQFDTKVNLSGKIDWD